MSLNLDLCFLPATQLVELIRTKKVSVTQVIQAHLDQIERLNPSLNAIVTLTTDSAMQEAHRADKQLAAG